MLLSGLDHICFCSLASLAPMNQNESSIPFGEGSLTISGRSKGYDDTMESVENSVGTDESVNKGERVRRIKGRR